MHHPELNLLPSREVEQVYRLPRSCDPPNSRKFVGGLYPVRSDRILFAVGRKSTFGVPALCVPIPEIGQAKHRMLSSQTRPALLTAFTPQETTD